RQHRIDEPCGITHAHPPGASHASHAVAPVAFAADRRNTARAWTQYLLELCTRDELGVEVWPRRAEALRCVELHHAYGGPARPQRKGPPPLLGLGDEQGLLVPGRRQVVRMFEVRPHGLVPEPFDGLAQIEHASDERRLTGGV